MGCFRLESIHDGITELALPLWKNYNSIYPGVKKNSKGMAVILDWITSIVEWKLKSETMKNLEQRFPEVS